METKQKIIDTYKTLVKENKTADVSVAEICRTLDISRKTFYNYFHDRYAIVDTIMFDEIEKWGKSHNVNYALLCSDMEREGAHQFYGAIGCKEVKGFKKYM